MQNKNEYLEYINNRRLVSGNPKGTVVSLFCGGGGLDLGLEFSGFKCVYATDIEMSYCETVQFNLGAMTEACDIRELSGKRIKKVADISQVDLIAGGPPCQSFSILGQRNSIQDDRGKLVFEYARIINELKPRAFVFENVPGMLTVNQGKDWREILDFFREQTKYAIYSDVLNSADFGIPQIRKRVFLVGMRDKASRFQFPKPTHNVPSQEEMLFSKGPFWIPSKFALEEVDALPNHEIRIHGDRVRARYKKIPQGGRDRVDHTDRIHPERASGTVLVGSAAGGGRPFIHPYEPRHISVREAARLQSFPDWYVIKGTSTQQYRQVGNAVPPILAMHVGRAIGEALKVSKVRIKRKRSPSFEYAATV